jgi:hypothetical protein
VITNTNGMNFNTFKTICARPMLFTDNIFSHVVTQIAIKEIVHDIMGSKQQGCNALK